MSNYEDELGRLTPRALTERMREDPSHWLYKLGLVAFDDLAQAQLTPDGVDSILSWESEFKQAYDGYWQAEVIGFRSDNATASLLLSVH